jgi:parallel beta-helix repeat protein
MKPIRSSYRPGTGEFFLNASMPSVPKTIYVDDDFSDDPSEHRWDTIQEGVDDAADGDTVVVCAGEYVENVDVGKQITLEGGGADVVTVRAADASDDVFYVTADWVSISGFTVTGATAKYSCKAGIRLSSVNRCSISENNALNNYDGIRLYSSNNNILQNNTASNNDNGIRLGDLSNNMLHSNNASNNNHGISLQSSSNNMLTENTMSGNVYNFGVYYSYSLSDNTQNIDTSNTVDGKPIYYWVDQQDKQIPGDAGFVGVVNSTNITVRDLTLTKNVEGVLFAYTENSKIENVTASNNDDYGICLYSSSNNMLTDNTASNNYRGIHLRNSGNNTLMSNNANSNGLHGIYLEGSSCLEDSSNNTLKKNTMSGNRYNFGVRHSLNYPQNIDTSNTVDGKPIYYWVDQEDMTIPDDAGFVGVVNCTNITVRDLILTNNEHGVLFEYTENSRIENVSASNCDEGIELKTHSSNNTVANNTISDNYRGIFLAYSHNNTVVNNTASNNGEGIELGGSNNNTLMDNTASNNRGNGIYLWWHSNNNVLQSNTASNNRGGIELQAHSNNNTLYHNNHLNNTDHNAYDSCTNTWDSGSAGNYYSDYNSIDPDGDGIGNDPHPIPGGTSIDRYPLMQPWAGGTSQKGDLNHDGTLTSADVLIALEIAVSGGYLIGADIDESGYVNALDARMIMQAAAGVTDSL